MNDRSLSSLYRRLVAARPAAGIGADELAGALEGGAGEREAMAAKLAASAPHADLARMLQALRPASQALADDVGAVRRGAAHPVRGRELRPAAGGARRPHARPLRWVGAVAACLAVALGLWSGRSDRPDSRPVASATRRAPANDRIFTSQDVIFSSSVDSAKHSRGGGSDEVFRANFSG